MSSRSDFLIRNGLWPNDARSSGVADAISPQKKRETKREYALRDGFRSSVICFLKQSSHGITHAKLATFFFIPYNSRTRSVINIQ